MRPIYGRTGPLMGRQFKPGQVSDVRESVLPRIMPCRSRQGTGSKARSTISAREESSRKAPGDHGPTIVVNRRTGEGKVLGQVIGINQEEGRR